MPYRAKPRHTEPNHVCLFCFDATLYGIDDLRLKFPIINKY